MRNGATNIRASWRRYVFPTISVLLGCLVLSALALAPFLPPEYIKWWTKLNLTPTWWPKLDLTKTYEAYGTWLQGALTPALALIALITWWYQKEGQKDANRIQTQTLVFANLHEIYGQLNYLACCAKLNGRPQPGTVQTGHLQEVDALIWSLDHGNTHINSRYFRRLSTVLDRMTDLIGKLIWTFLSTSASLSCTIKSKSYEGPKRRLCHVIESRRRSGDIVASCCQADGFAPCGEGRSPEPAAPVKRMVLPEKSMTLSSVQGSVRNGRSVLRSRVTARADLFLEKDLVAAELRFDPAYEMQILAEHSRLLHEAFAPQRAMIAAGAGWRRLKVNGLDFARVESNVVGDAALEGTALAC